MKWLNYQQQFRAVKRRMEQAKEKIKNQVPWYFIFCHVMATWYTGQAQGMALYEAKEQDGALLAHLV